MLQMLLCLFHNIHATSAFDRNVIERKIGYTFQDKSLLTHAFSHNSLPQQTDFQRLEFLGDRIVGAVVAADVYSNGTHLQPGQLHYQFESKTTNEYLARRLQGMGLGNYVKTNPSSNRNKIYSEVLEALIAAIFLDSNGIAVLPEKIRQHVCSILTNKNISYKFENQSLLDSALRHSSLPGSERFQGLKFLGERILYAVIADNIFRHTSGCPIKELQEYFESVIQPKNLAQRFKGINLAESLKYNPNNSLDTIYSDALKALTGAIYLDCFRRTGYEKDSKIKQLVLNEYYQHVEPEAKVQLGVTRRYESGILENRQEESRVAHTAKKQIAETSSICPTWIVMPMILISSVYLLYLYSLSNGSALQRA